MTSETRKKILCHLVRALFAVIVVFHVGWISNYLFREDLKTTRAWFGLRLPVSWQGFSETFEWIRSHTDDEAALATFYDPMYYLYAGPELFGQPGFHKPQTYFYPYGQAVADIGAVNEIKSELKALGVRLLVIDPLDGFAEGRAYLRLFNELVRSYRDRPELMFISSDSKHRIYALPQE